MAQRRVHRHVEAVGRKRPILLAAYPDVPAVVGAVAEPGTARIMPTSARSDRYPSLAVTDVPKPRHVERGIGAPRGRNRVRAEHFRRFDSRPKFGVDASHRDGHVALNGAPATKTSSSHGVADARLPLRFRSHEPRGRRRVCCRTVMPPAARRSRGASFILADRPTSLYFAVTAACLREVTAVPRQRLPAGDDAAVDRTFRGAVAGVHLLRRFSLFRAG